VPSFRKNLILGTLYILFSSYSSLAIPNQSAFQEIPRQFQNTELTLGSKGLNEICLSRDIMPDTTVCNPAFLPDFKESSLLARVYLGNGYTALSMANQFIYQPISKDFLKEMFQHQNVTRVDANISLVFVTRYFSASFSPYRIQYVSEIHNPNFPVVAVHASVEKSIVFSAGFPIWTSDQSTEMLSIGAKFRILQRKYVHSFFSLFQAMSEDPRILAPVRSQNALFLDPFLGWSSSKLFWKPRFSLSIQNIGTSWPYDPLYSEPSDLAVGIGIAPFLGVGQFRLGVDISNLLHAENLESRFRMGTSYRLGILEPMLGLSKNTVTGGVLCGFQIFQAGIIYQWFKSYVASISSENKIATEFSIKL
jgi:hypothetical protein